MVHFYFLSHDAQKGFFKNSEQSDTTHAYAKTYNSIKHVPGTMSLKFNFLEAFVSVRQNVIGEWENDFYPGSFPIHVKKSPETSELILRT